VLRPPARPLAATWVAMRLKSGNVVDSFWPGNEMGPAVSPCSRAKGTHCRALVIIEPVAGTAAVRFRRHLNHAQWRSRHRQVKVDSARIIGRFTPIAVRDTIRSPLFRRRGVCRAPEIGTPYDITHTDFAIVPRSAGI
jgi:hypothetical protein